MSSMRKWIDIVEAIGGDCYQNAWRRLMDMDHDEAKKWTLVHAEVVGSRGSAIAGKHFGHAWLETRKSFGEHSVTFVSDQSNGRNIELPQDFYYDMGGVIDEPGKLFRYTIDEARRWALQTGHFGSWELEVEGCGI